MPRTSIFEKHPKGLTTWKLVINDKISFTKAAKILGCSVANISKQVKRYKESIQSEEDKTKIVTKKINKSAKPIQTTETIKKEEELLVLDPDASLESIGALAWRELLTELINKSKEQYEPKEFIAIVRELRQFLEFQIKQEVPEVETKVIKLDQAQEESIIDAIIGSVCVNCPYHREAIARKDKAQIDARLLSQ